MISTETLPFTVYASQEEISGYQITYDVDMNRYFDAGGECRIELSAYADFSTGEMFISTEQIFKELLHHGHSRGTRYILTDEGPQRYTSELGDAYPGAQRIRSFIPSATVSLLSESERELLSHEVKIRNPRSGKMVSVFNIRAMDTICTMYDLALRMDALANKKQIETAILLQKLRQQLTREAIALKFKAIHDPESLSPVDEVSLYGKPSSVIRPRKIWSEEVYQTFAWLRGSSHDLDDQDRYRRNAPVMNDIKRFGYGFISPAAKNQIRAKKNGSNIRFGNCLNNEGLKLAALGIAKASEVARLHYKAGEHDKFMADLNSMAEQIGYNVLLDSDG